MKKSLIALAALSAFATAAQAQSSVTIYGIADVGLSSVKNTASNVTTTYTTSGDGTGSLSSSRLGFRGTEDLGGGLKANFNVEWGGSYSNGAVPSARVSYVGLSDATKGEIRLGKQVGLAHSIGAANQAGGANNTPGHIYYNTANSTADERIWANDVLVDNQTQYHSPRIAGVQAKLAYGQNTTQIQSGNTTGTRQTGIALNYTVGKLTLDAGQTTLFTHGASTATASNEVIRLLGATYDFGVAKLFVLNAESKTENGSTNVQSAKNAATEIGVRVPVNAKVDLWANVFDGDGETTAGAGRVDRKGNQIGVGYNFSKRTLAYAMIGQQEETTVSSGATEKVKATVVGVRHSF
jgi:predicted porin